VLSHTIWFSFIHGSQTTAAHSYNFQPFCIRADPALVAARAVENFETGAVFKINGEISGALVNYDSYDLAGEECQCFLLSIQRGLQTELLFVISVPEINPSIDHNSPWTAYICARSALESE